MCGSAGFGVRYKMKSMCVFPVEIPLGIVGFNRTKMLEEELNIKQTEQRKTKLTSR